MEGGLESTFSQIDSIQLEERIKNRISMFKVIKFNISIKARMARILASKNEEIASNYDLDLSILDTLTEMLEDFRTRLTAELQRDIKEKHMGDEEEIR